jgi:hypothetical protein
VDRNHPVERGELLRLARFGDFRAARPEVSGRVAAKACNSGGFSGTVSGYKLSGRIEVSGCTGGGAGTAAACG